METSYYSDYPYDTEDDEREESSGSAGKVVGALLVGALAGVALGMLYAPGKGERLRRDLKNKAKDLKEDITEKVKEEVEMFKDKAEELKCVADDMISDLKKNFKLS